MRALALVLLSDAGRTFQLERSFTSHSISATTRAVTELNFSECQKWSRPGPANWCHASGRLLKFSEDVSDDTGMLLPRRATVTQTCYYQGGPLSLRPQAASVQSWSATEGPTALKLLTSWAHSDESLLALNLESLPVERETHMRFSYEISLIT